MQKNKNDLPDSVKGIRAKFGTVGILIFIIAAELIYTTFVFVNHKEGFHSDEIWSYGLANSYYQPFIYFRDGVHADEANMLSDTVNLNEWLPGSTMKDYITVQPGERFAYDSVYHNQTLDYHPPLYYMLLHTVCSFFPDTFSPYFGFFLNCVFLIVTQVFLYKLSKRILGSGFYALVVCFFYAASVGALSTYIFIRQYSLLTMLIVMYAYFNARLYYDKEGSLKKNLPPIAITAFAAFMTHYYAIVFIGGFTAVFCLLYLCRKKIGKMFIYGGTILLTLILFFAVYPAALTHIGYNDFLEGAKFHNSNAFGYWTQMRFFIMYICRNTMGIRITVYKSATIYYVIAAVIALTVLGAPLCFLFRKEKWFKKFKDSVFDSLALIKESLLHGDRFPFIIILAAAVQLLVVNKTANTISSGLQVQRYIFNIFPYGSLMMVYAVKLLICVLPKIKAYAKPLTAVIIALLTVNIHLGETTAFTFDSSPRYQQIADDLAGKNCLFLIDTPGRMKPVYTVFTSILYKAEYVFCTFFIQADTYKEEIFDSGIDIDYVIISADTYLPPDKLSEAKEKLSSDLSESEIYDFQDPKVDLADIGMSEEERNARLEKRIRLTEEFNSYFKDKEPDIVYETYANGMRFYVMAVK